MVHLSSGRGMELVSTGSGRSWAAESTCPSELLIDSVLGGVCSGVKLRHCSPCCREKKASEISKIPKKMCWSIYILLFFPWRTWPSWTSRIGSLHRMKNFEKSAQSPKLLEIAKLPKDQRILDDVSLRTSKAFKPRALHGETTPHRLIQILSFLFEQVHSQLDSVLALWKRVFVLQRSRKRAATFRGWCRLSMSLEPFWKPPFTIFVRALSYRVWRKQNPHLRKAT